MRKLALLIVALMLGSSALAQKVWRDIEVTHNCLEAEALLQSYDDVTITRDCNGQDMGFIEGKVSWLFDASNVSFDINFQSSGTSNYGWGPEFSLLEFKPGSISEPFISGVVQSFTEAYGTPVDYRSKKTGERLPSGGVFWYRGDGMEALLFVTPHTREAALRIYFVRNDADQF